jgi:hypothetical protein
VSGRSWFAGEGSLERLDYDGPSFFRFPQAVAGDVIERYCAPGDWVIDPFCGFGSTLVVAERPGRHAVGCEVGERRAAFSAARLDNPDRVVHGRCEDLTPAQRPPFALLFTSPPYGSFQSGDHDDDPATYLADAPRLFSGFARLLGSGATVAVRYPTLMCWSSTFHSPCHNTCLRCAAHPESAANHDLCVYPHGVTRDLVRRQQVARRTSGQALSARWVMIS